MLPVPSGVPAAGPDPCFALQSQRLRKGPGDRQRRSMHRWHGRRTDYTPRQSVSCFAANDPVEAEVLCG